MRAWWFAALVLAVGAGAPAPALADMYPDASNATSAALPNLSGALYGRAYGMRCNNAGDDKPALQAAIDAAQLTGAQVVLPTGICRLLSGVSITDSVRITGASMQGTVLRTMDPVGSVIVINTDDAVTLEEFSIDAPGITKTAGAAIDVTGPSGNLGSNFRHLQFGAGLWDGFVARDGFAWSLTDSRFSSQKHNNITIMASEAFPDAKGGGIKITNNAFYNLNTKATCNAVIETNGGGAQMISNNKMLGCAYNIWLNVQHGPTGTLLISNNGFEQAYAAGIGLMQGTAGKEYGNVAITGNEFSNLAGVIPINGSIYIGPGTPNTAPRWIRNVNIVGNHTNNAVLGTSQLQIMDGEGITIAANVLDGNNVDGVTGILVGPAATNVTIAPDNVGVRLDGGLFAPGSSWDNVAIPLGPSPNLLLNGDIALDQVNEGTAPAVPNVAGYAVDGWLSQKSTTSGVTATAGRSAANLLPGAAQSLLYTVTTAGATGASDYGRVIQRVEAAALSGTGFGAAGAKGLVVSYHLRASIAGAYTISLVNGATNNRIYRDSCTVPASTWTRCVHFIPGDVGGTWATSGSTNALSLNWITTAGPSVNTGALRAWTAGTTGVVAVPGQVNLNETLNATLQLTNVKLEVGSLPTPFAAPLPAAELARAQRYYRKTFAAGTKPATNAGLAGARCVTATSASAGALGIHLPFDPPMAASPAVTTYNPSAANANWRNVTGAADAAVLVDPATALGPSGVQIGEQTTALVVGNQYCIHAVADARL